MDCSVCFSLAAILGKDLEEDVDDSYFCDSDDEDGVGN